jgi:hypothetical protein
MIGLLFIIILLILCISGIIYGVQLAGRGINKVVIYLKYFTANTDKLIIVALIAGSVSIVGVVITSIVSKFLEYRFNVKKYLFEKRERSYEDFVELVYKIQNGVVSGKNITNDEMTRDIIKFSKGLTLWGSSKVIKKWLKFREFSNGKQDTESTQLLFIMENILFEIRRDMGQKGKLRKGDLLKFFVNDIDKYLYKQNINAINK